MASTRKPGALEPPSDWSPWAAVRFPNERARFQFLRSVATREEKGWAAEPDVDDDRSALVRWRVGQFLRLNDLAYSLGGRIVVTSPHRSV